MPEVSKITLNDISLLALKDSAHTFEASVFSDIDQYPARKAMMPDGKFKAVTKAYVVKTANHIALIDSGWGTESGVNGKTKQLLIQQGIQPSEVTDILLTHMDIDHISGLVEQNKPVYPNAKLHIAKAEYDAWIVRGDARIAEYVITLARKVAGLYKDRIALFDYGDTLLPGVVAQDARGHTAGHTIYDITSGNKGITIVGDMIHVAPIQLRFTDYCTIYDANPSMAAATRERILAKLSQEDRLIAGMHFTAIGKVKPAKEGGYMIVPSE